MEIITQKLDQINLELITDKVIHRMSDSFKALGDPTRLQILLLLFTGERHVSELADHLNVTQSAVSHQLRLLRNLDIVRFRKDGREVYYDLADDHVREILMLALEHITND